MPIQLLTLCIHTAEKRTKTIKGCETWLVPVDVSIVAAVRGVFVLLRVPCVQTLVPTPLPSHLSLDVRGAVLTGTAFFLYIATCRPGAIKIVIQPISCAS